HPFNLTADPRFLFPSPQHREALSFLHYGIMQRKGFLAITGEVGTGKTTLCRALLSQLDAHVTTAFILNSNLTEFQLLHAIIEDFGIPINAKNKMNLMRALNTFLLEQVRQGNNAVLIIDEAQNLTAAQLEQVRMLSNIETAEEKLLQIVLVGQPQLRRKLDSKGLLQLRQRIAIRFHLSPLARHELGAYIAHRLHVAGSDGRVLFEPKAVDLAYDYSGGVPRLVNMLCDKALLAGFALGTAIITPRIMRASMRELDGEPELTAAALV
ncbi:MAG: AAA family ATPase, partial [Candidatus Aureabacteria bacterium]|nr:AAA family ATPase [Candidatus Auribacterota bacterium]